MLFDELKLRTEMEEKAFMDKAIELLGGKVDNKMMVALDFLRALRFPPEAAYKIIKEGHLDAVTQDAREALIDDPEGYFKREEAKALQEGHYVSY